MKRIWLLLFLPLFLIVFLWFTIRYTWYVIFEPEESWRLAVSLDQLANTTFNGHEDETISSRAGRLKDDEKWACLLCKFLDHLDPDHCKKSIGV